MKKLIGSISLLFILVMLVSCTGIGDGALIDNVQTSGEGETASSAVIDDGNAEWYCVLTLYDTEDDGSSRVRLGYEDTQELINLITTGEYDNYRETDSLSNAYIMIESEMFEETSTAFNAFTTGYRIYSDDFVAEMNWASSWLPGLWPLGKQEGIYERVIEIMNKANKGVEKSESAAGFAFDRLIVCTKPGYSPLISDFEDLGCIGIRHLMDDKTNNSVWWTLTLDSDTEDEIRNIAAEIKSREGIISVEFDYLLTLD